MRDRDESAACSMEQGVISFCRYALDRNNKFLRKQNITIYYVVHAEEVTFL